MKSTSTLHSWIGAMLFFAGVLIGLALSATVAWGQIEANLYTSFSGESRFGLTCPLMLSEEESGIVRVQTTNLTEEIVTPQIFAEISHPGGSRILKQTITLAPGESKPMEWVVDSSDGVFKRLILVAVLQARYRENSSYLGSCGILLFSLFGLTGMQTFFLVMFLSLAAMGFGAALWRRSRQPLGEALMSFARINAALMTITLLSLLSAFLRVWGLTIFLDALILLVIGIMITDFGLVPRGS